MGGQENLVRMVGHRWGRELGVVSVPGDLDAHLLHPCVADPTACRGGAVLLPGAESQDPAEAPAPCVPVVCWGEEGRWSAE